jgi:NAD-dependent deacetylase
MSRSRNPICVNLFHPCPTLRCGIEPGSVSWLEMNALTPDDTRQIEQVADLLRGCKSLLFITGAGLSADSGLPTYRGIGGLYETGDAEDQRPIEEVLSGRGLLARPELAWKHLLRIEQGCRGARPNRGHDVIAEMERHFERAWVLTQNVDGFHRQAGSRQVIDIHGDLHSLRCLSCPYEQTVEDYAGFSLPPRCPEYEGVLRPKVVLFGEQLPMRQLATYYAEIPRGFDLIFSIGTTSVFPYIAEPVVAAWHERKPSVEINPGETEVSAFATIKLRLEASAALEAIWDRYQRSVA